MDAGVAGDVVLVVNRELAANAIVLHSDSGLPGGTFTVRVFGHKRGQLPLGASHQPRMKDQG